MLDTPYEDLLYLPRPVSSHTPMPTENRAAQFASFAALHGHEEAICETARLTDRQIDLDDTQKECIDRVLQQAAADPTLRLRLTCYEPDAYKDGGRYITVISGIKRIDTVTQQLILTDGTRLPPDHITDAYLIGAAETDLPSDDNCDILVSSLSERM